MAVVVPLAVVVASGKGFQNCPEPAKAGSNTTTNIHLIESTRSDQTIS
jgi:hypothetical protein